MAAVYPLANPKGVQRNCELCEQPAFILCTKCRVTYYCGAEHQEKDWIGIHEKICQMLIPLRTPIPFLSSEEERRHRKHQLLMRQKHMIDLTRTAGEKLLFEGKYQEAIPAAMQCLRFSVEIYGLASVELVPAYLILAEASVGMGKLPQAEEYLSQARWTVRKTPACPNNITYKLCRNLGLLYTAKGQFDGALRELADDVYHASEEYGTHDIRTSGGYFHMANIFFHRGQLETANSLYKKVTDIWQEFLTRMVQTRLEIPKVTSVLGAVPDDFKDSELELDEAQQAECVQVLNAIFDIQVNQSQEKANGVANIAHTMAMLYYILGDIDKAKEYGRKAVAASGEIQDEEFSRTIVDFLKVCENINVQSEGIVA